MRSPSSVARITDPKKRLAAAARLKTDADTAAKPHRVYRDEAIISAYLDERLAPVKVYKPLGISRALFADIIGKAPEAGDHARVPDPVTRGVEASTEVQKYEAIGERAVKIRDSTAMLLIYGGTNVDGKEVERLTAAEVSRIAGISTARVTQIVNRHLKAQGVRA